MTQVSSNSDEDLLSAIDRLLAGDDVSAWEHTDDAVLRKLAQVSKRMAVQRRVIQQREAGIEEILGLLLDIAEGNFEFSVLFNEEDELLSALHMGLNMMAEELEASHSATKEARDQAVRASRYKSDFVASVSHELRTPLTAIIGYAEIIREDAEIEANPTLIDDADNILSAAQHLLRIIANILDLSKIEAGKMELDPQLFPTDVFVEELRVTATPLIEKHHNAFIVDVDPQIGVLYTDRTKLSQVVLNLLSNASKFTKQGTITLKARRLSDATSDQPDMVRFDVIDTGIGISPEKLEAIFKPFTQETASTSRHYGGTGLGLTISQSFCQLMGGRLEVASTQGQGSIFSVIIPARVEA